MTQSVIKLAGRWVRLRSSSFRRRVVAFALVLAALTLLIVVIDTNIWLEQSHLQEGFLAIKAEEFYFDHEVYAKMIADLEQELFSQAIRLAQGNQAKAARWLGVTRLKMREKLLELGLHPGSDGTQT